jgi:hypothetical protein
MLKYSHNSFQFIQSTPYAVKYIHHHEFHECSMPKIFCFDLFKLQQIPIQRSIIHTIYRSAY